MERRWCASPGWEKTIAYTTAADEVRTYVAACRRVSTRHRHAEKYSRRRFSVFLLSILRNFRACVSRDFIAISFWFASCWRTAQCLGLKIRNKFIYFFSGRSYWTCLCAAARENISRIDGYDFVFGVSEVPDWVSSTIEIYACKWHAFDCVRLIGNSIAITNIRCSRNTLNAPTLLRTATQHQFGYQANEKNANEKKII